MRAIISSAITLSIAVASCFFGVSCSAPNPSDKVSPTPAEAPISISKETPAKDTGVGAFNLVGMYPLEDEAFSGRLVLYFDMSLHAPGPGDPVQITPFSFVPPLEGIYTWGESHINFQAMENIVNARSIYELKLNPGLQAVDLSPISEPTAPLFLATYVLEAQKMQLLEETEEFYSFNLLFSATPDEKALQESLQVSDALGAILELTDFRLNGTTAHFKTAKAPLPLRAFIPKGLPAQDARVKSLSDFRAAFPSDKPLAITGASWKHERYYNQLTVDFNDPVQAEKVGDALVLRDKENGEIFPVYAQDNGESSTVRFSIEADMSHLPTLELTIPAGLYNTNAQKLPEDFVQQLEAEYEALTISYTYWQGGRVDGATLRLNLNYSVDPASVEERLSFEPEVKNFKVDPSSYEGVDVVGDFVPDTRYQVTIAAGVSDLKGRKLNEKPIFATLEPTPQSSAARFAYGDKVYFPKRVSGKMKVEARNVEKVNVSFNKIFPNNIPLALRPHDRHEAVSDRWAKNVGNIEIEVPKDAPNTTHELGVDIAELVAKEGFGVYTAWISPGSYDQDNYKVVVWTNLGVMAHWSGDEALIFVHDLFTLTPTPGANVTVYSDKNQILGTGVSDALGAVKIGPFESYQGSPSVAVVATDDDQTFITLERRNDEMPFKDNMPYYDDKSFDAFLYCDRNLYRPGEMMHARAIVRKGDGTPAADTPLQMRLINPNEQVAHEAVLQLGALGTGGVDIQTQGAFATGKYRLEIAIPGDAGYINAIPIFIEEFVPNRMRVEVQIEGETLQAGETSKVKVKAEHLFGASAADRSIEAFVILQEGEWKNEEFPAYHFGHDDPFAPETIELGEEMSDSNGEVVFTKVLRTDKAPGKLLKATVRGLVQELGGRPVQASKSVPYLPEDKLLGIAVQSAADQRSLNVQVAAVDSGGTPLSLDSVKVTLERQSWSYYVRRFDSHNDPRFTRRYIPIQTLELPLLNGMGELKLDIPDEYGYFRVRVHSDATSMYSTRTLYRTWRDIQEVEDSSPSMLKLHLDKKEYAIGDEAVLKIESPFDGQAYIVLQGAQFETPHRVPVVDGKGELRFIVTAEHVPNIWAEVTVVHTVRDDSPGLYPYSSNGAANVIVRNPTQTLQVALLGVPESVRPETTLSFTVSTKNNEGVPVPAELTVAVVDEGIHSILDYLNPDPLGWFARSRQPFYNRAHYYDKVAYDFEFSQIGGDVLERRLGKDTPTLDENWIKPLALWSGAVMTDEAGQAVLSFDLPKFNGELRVVAVAANATSTGSASAHLKVRQPYMLQLGLPRFALPSDSLEVNTLLFNTTQENVKAQIAWKGEGTLAGNTGSRDIEVPAQGEFAFWSAFNAADNQGQGKIIWTITVFDQSGATLESMEEETLLPVREAAAYQTHQELIVLQPGESRELGNTLFLDDARTGSAITVSANPLTRLKDSLEYVLGYPHGCLEQTASRTSLLYLMRRSGALQDLVGSNIALDSYIQSGVDRMLAMQLSSGAMSFWPGRNYYNAYGTVYAGHILTQIYIDGHYQIQEQPFRRLQAALRDIAGNATLTQQHELYTRAYALYVLALDGDIEALQDIERMDALALPRSARFMLAAALAMNTQDPARAKAYLDRIKSEPYNDRLQYGNFNSAPRNTAVELISMLAIGMEMDAVHKKAESLLHFLETGDVITTQDKAFVVSALTRYFDHLGGDLSQAKVEITSPKDDVSISGSDVHEEKNEGPGNSYTIRNTGGHIAFVHFTTSGIPKAPRMTPLEEGIKVSRSYTDDTGAIVEANVFAHGNAYLVNLGIELEASVDHLVVVDMLPAGFEIVNPRLDENALNQYDIYGGIEASHLEVRDDRLVAAFEYLESGQHNFYYLLRAVSPGVFQQPAVHAECMYDPAIRGADVWRTVEVHKNK